MNLNNYVPAKEAAATIGISYSLFMSRLYHDKVKFEKVGYAVLIPKKEVTRLKKVEDKRRADASDQGVERATG